MKLCPRCGSMMVSDGPDHMSCVKCNKRISTVSWRKKIAPEGKIGVVAGTILMVVAAIVIYSGIAVSHKPKRIAVPAEKSKSAAGPIARNTPRLSLSEPGRIWQTKSGYLVAESDSLLRRALEIARSNDRVALSKMMKSGRVGFLGAGVEVYVTDLTWGGTIKIRPVGQLGEVWTVREAVK